VLGPRIGSRIEQRHDAVGFRVHRSDVRPFEAIALEAGEREVGQFGLRTVLGGDDVVGFVSEECAALGYPAVFATTSPPARARRL
jgi:hypothetical protein